MGILGRVTLKFGGTGDADDSPLEFETGHINLIVGPNNSGKSLFLRELSGVNPRAAHAPGYRRDRSAPASIIERADWSLAIEQELREGFVSEALADDRWKIVGERTWADLLSGLQSAADSLFLHRSAFAERVFGLCEALIDTKLPIGKMLLGLADAEPGRRKGLDELIVMGAMFLMVMRSVDPADGDEDEAVEAPHDSTPPLAIAEPAHDDAPSQSILSDEQFEELEGHVLAFWASAREALLALKVSTDDLAIDEVLDAGVLIPFVADRIRETPLAFIFDVDEVPNVDPIDDPELTARCRRIWTIVQWMANPQPLADLAHGLEEKDHAHRWSNPDMRENCSGAVLYLDGLSRLSMTGAARLEEFGREADSSVPILALLKNPERMALLRSLVMDALGAFLVIDMTTNAPSVLWRLSQDAPPEGIETSFTEASNAYHVKADPLSEQSDGLHALVGMLMAIVAGDAGLVFIDEPEAFLHPPLVRKLARLFTQIARHLDRQFFIATHSPEMLASAAVGVDVNVIRLTYRDRVPTARLLGSDTLRMLALDPLMRSESALSALFHDGAVVCEAAADRVLYQEVNERLLLCEDDAVGGLESVVFLNAQNWQTVPRIVGPLRRVGVAAAAVIDADALFESQMTTVLEAACVPKPMRKAILSLRADLRMAIGTRLGLDVKKVKLERDSLSGLTKPEMRQLHEILDLCAKYGVFVVPVGELEDWLAPLGLKRRRDKSKWLRQALERLGCDPTADDYVWPSEGDIWGFIRRIVAWVEDPARSGTNPTE